MIAAIIASDEMSEHIRLTIKTTLKLNFGSALSSSLTDATQAVQISDYRQHHGPLPRRLLGSWLAGRSAAETQSASLFTFKTRRKSQSCSGHCEPSHG